MWPRGRERGRGLVVEKGLGLHGNFPRAPCQIAHLLQNPPLCCRPCPCVANVCLKYQDDLKLQSPSPEFLHRAPSPGQHACSFRIPPSLFPPYRERGGRRAGCMPVSLSPSLALPLLPLFSLSLPPRLLLFFILSPSFVNLQVHQTCTPQETQRLKVS